MDPQLENSIAALAAFKLRPPMLASSSSTEPTASQPGSFDDSSGCGSVERMLGDAQGDLEHGYIQNSDGTFYVAVLTEFGEEVTGAMFDWWFLFADNTQKYLWWHPFDHIQVCITGH